MNEPVIKTVVEIDLKGYSEIVREVEEFCQEFRQKFGCDNLNLLPFINRHIQNFIDKGLETINKKREDVVQATNGDNAVIILDNADEAYKFATAVHKATKSYNDKQTEPSAERRFRIGAATGELVENYDGNTLTGYTIVKAYRLEANAEPGKYFVVDVETHKSFSPEIHNKFGDEKTVYDKNNKEFQAHICQIIYDNSWEYFDKLNDREKQIVYKIGLEDTEKQEISEDHLIRRLVEEVIVEKEHSSQTVFVLTEKFLNYFPEIIINAILEEIKEKRLNILKNYSIFKILERLNLESLKERLQTLIQIDGLTLADYLINIIKNLQKEENDGNLSENYAVGNIFNLLIKLNIKKNFSYFDLSNISIWNADLTEAILTGVDFSNSDLKNSKFSQPLGCIHSIAFNTDGSYFATGDAHGSIRVHNTKTLELCFFHNERKSQIWSVAFRKDNKHNKEKEMLAWGAEDGSVRLYEITTNTSSDNKTEPNLIHEINETKRILSVAFSPDGNTLAIGGDENIKVIKINHSYAHSSTLNVSQISCMTFISNDCIASGSQDGHIRLSHIEPRNRNKDASWTVHPQAVLRCIAYHSTKKILAIGGEDGKLHLLHLDPNNRYMERFDLKTEISQVRTLAFNQDGNILAVGCIDNNLNGESEHKIKLWSFSENNWIDTLEGHEHAIRSLAFCPQSHNPKLLVSGGDGRTVLFWHQEDKRWELSNRKLEGYANRIWSVALSRDGKTFACGGEDSKIHLWNYHERTHIPLQTLDKHSNWVWSVAFSPNADILASACEDNKIYLWGLQEGKWQHICELVGNSEIKGHEKRVRCVVFHPDGYNLASAGNDNKIILWDITDLQSPQILSGFTKHTDRVLSVAFSPDGNYLASSSRDQNIYLIEVDTNHKPYSLGNNYLLGNHSDSHKDQVHSIAFSPDSNKLVSGDFDRELKLWDVKRQKLIGHWYGYQKILSVAFHPKKQIVASAGHDHIIQLWDVDDPNNVKLIKTFKGHKRTVESVVFTPDGKQLISCSQDQTIKFWQVEGEINISIHTLELGKPYQGMSISGVKGFDLPQILALEELGASK
ncbi:pentapeptide repeat-containing protein [Nostoc sp. PCC 7107]|uniref:WD40 domain-containing protein n=1 Tax=Nostoc sp. PCC 7107 TaxID=317936 RepID=UPI00029F14A6|nr:pentapeptide repeat-containing protein [Nostoc sp. PCC 7107]AFY44686.1 pentapeptide repeat protein [Nostoc sp. PCC 7107]